MLEYEKKIGCEFCSTIIPQLTTDFSRHVSCKTMELRQNNVCLCEFISDRTMKSKTKIAITYHK